MSKAARLTDTGSGHDGSPPGPVTSGSPDVFINGQPAARKGDTLAPHDGHQRIIAEGSSSVRINGKPAARVGDGIECGGVIISGSGNVIIGDTPYKSPVHDCALRAVENGDPLLMLSPMLTITPVFAKSCLRGEGCTDAGMQPEPHQNFPPMAFYRAAPDARSKSEPEQHALVAKKQTVPVADQRPWYQKLFTPEPDAPQSSETPPVEVATPPFFPGAPLLHAGGVASTLGTWLLRAATAAGQYATAAVEADATSSLTRVLFSGPGAPLAAVAVGMFPGKLNAGEQDFIDKMRLAQIAERYGTAPTRVRFQWQKQADGRLMPVGYHTEQGHGADQVPVRMMALNTQTGYYEFTTDGPRPVTILWTPESIDIDVPAHTGNEDPLHLPDTITVLPIPNQAGWIEHYPAPEERGFRDYILILPLPDIPPIYIYLSKPPVEPIETGHYDELAKRSIRDGLDIDHIPSQGAIREYFRQRYGSDIDQELVELAVKKGAAVALPRQVHLKNSETYGGKNNRAKKHQDGSDLKAAVDSNVNAIATGLREEGVTEKEIDRVRADLHKINHEFGYYEPWE